MTLLPARTVVVLAVIAMMSTGVVCVAQAQSAGQRANATPAAPEQGPAWSTLPESQRRALQPLQAEWPRIDADRKKKWLEVAARLPTMSPDEQSRVRIRMAEWAQMTPTERGRARLQFQELRQLTSTDREERWRAYQSLPVDQRRALAEKAAPLAPAGTAAVAPPKPSAGLDVKNNSMPMFQQAQRAKPVGPTVVQSRPGATTSLVNKQSQVPAHQQAGMPKIAATKGFVDPTTLLPKRGPQGAAVATAAPSEKPASSRQ